MNWLIKSLRARKRELRRSPELGSGGQSTIEFILTLTILMGFVLFYLQLSLMMAFGNYVHYATFMAARAYLSAGPDPQDQEDRAKAVITRMVKRNNSPGIDRLPSVAKGDGGGDIKGLEFNLSEFNATDVNLSWMQGVRYRFKSRLFLMPVGKGGLQGNTPANTVTLISESWLGREPTYLDCQNDMGKFEGIFDNGC